MIVRTYFRQLRAADWVRDREQLFAVQQFLAEGDWPWVGTVGHLTRDQVTTFRWSFILHAPTNPRRLGMITGLT